MKNLKRKIVASLFMLFAVTTLSFAQTEEGANTDLKGKFRNNLTEEQKATVEANKEAAKTNRDAFKATLTDEQKAILENKELTREQRQEALKATLSEEQVQLMESNREAAKENSEAFKATLSDEQKAAMKNRAKKSNSQKGNKNGQGQGGN